MTPAEVQRMLEPLIGPVIPYDETVDESVYAGRHLLIYYGKFAHRQFGVVFRKSELATLTEHDVQLRASVARNAPGDAHRYIISGELFPEKSRRRAVLRRRK